jgi:hypothetical protein
MGIYVASFSAIAVSAAQDVFELTAHASSRVALRELRLGQYSDAGDSEAELLSVLILRGYTTSGSGGAAMTPANISGHSGAPAAVTVVERNNTTGASTGTPAVLLASAWNVQDEYLWLPDPDARPIIEVSTRVVVRITAPADALTTNGTLVFEEIGKVP